MKTECWYEFKAYNQETLYGFGTEKEASKYQDFLNKDRETNHYTMSVVKESEELDHSDLGFNLSDELKEINEA